MGFLFGLGLLLHVLFMIAVAVGVVFFFIWVAREMNAKSLKCWTKWLLIVGVVGCLVTVGAMFFGMRHFGGEFGFRGGMMNFEKGERENVGCPFLDKLDKGEVKGVPAKDAVPAVKATAPAVKAPVTPTK